MQLPPLFFSYVITTHKPMPHPAIVGRAVNEFLFPVGCALVLYTAEVWQKDWDGK